VNDQDEDQNNESLLHQAVRTGDLCFVHVLLSKGMSAVNLDLCDLNGYSPLMLAGVLGKLDIVKYLVACGADKNVKVIIVVCI
jgi:ankyrin repeat protein